MELPKHIKGAIFDLDGTLLDSLHAWADVDKRFFEKRNLPVPEGYYNAIKTLDLRGAALYTKSLCSLPDSPEDLISEWLSMIREEYALHIEMKENAKEYLFRLHGAGVKLGIATSSEPELFLPCLRRHGVDELFSCYTATSEARSKEHPDVYLLTAKKLGLPPYECAVFEDIPEGIRSAKLGGFYTVAIAASSSFSDFGSADRIIEKFDLS